MLGVAAFRVYAFLLLFLSPSGVDALALPGEVHRYRLNQWTGLDDELTAGYNPLIAHGGATEAANTGRSFDDGTWMPGAPFTCLPQTTRCAQGYRFGAGQGLALTNPNISATGPFSIVIDFMLDASAGAQKTLDRALSAVDVISLVELGDPVYVEYDFGVPEPGTWILTGAGLVYVAIRRRRRAATGG